MSPSQRRIVSNTARRRSHEIGRVTPIITPTRFLSLRSPVGGKHSGAVSPRGGGTLKRSPNRCTLKRGRPNTARVGLARPSPTRNTPRSVTTPLKVDDTAGGDAPTPPPLPPRKDSIPSATVISTTPLRRMSSVQELVNKLEKNRKNKSKGKLSSSSSSQNLDRQKASPSVVVISPENGELSTLSTKPSVIETDKTTMTAEAINTPLFSTSPTPVLTRSRGKSSREALHQQVKKTPQIFLSIDDEETEWVSGQNFKFDRKDFHLLQKKSGGDRDSIHFLKTLRAGKVPATVQYFNQIGHSRSPVKSLIPRYTGFQAGSSLQSQGESFKSSQNLNARTPDGQQPTQVTTPSRIARRMSSVDIDIRNRNRKEELLEEIKRESAALKRSNTTASAGRCGTHQRRAVRPSTTDGSQGFTRNPSFRRPTTLDLRPRAAPATDAVVSSSSKIVSRVPSLRRPPPTSNPQTPRIPEEDESLVLSVNRAIGHLLHPEEGESKKNPGSSERKKPGSASKSSITASPLKTSNIANSTLSRKESFQKKVSPSFSGVKPSPPLRGGVDAKRRVTITRTASENGTKSTTNCTPRTTPKIKKSLTTRAYDLRMNSGSTTPFRTPRRTPTTTTPTSTLTNPIVPSAAFPGTLLSSAHNCQTITPQRRRVPRMGNGSATPQTQNENTPNPIAKSRLRTPLRATHIFTTPSH